MPYFSSLHLKESICICFVLVLFIFVTICDAIKQNELEIMHITFLVFLLYKPHIHNATFCRKPMKISWLVSEIRAVEGFKNNRKQREFPFSLAVSQNQYLLVLIHFALPYQITSKIKYKQGKKKEKKKPTYTKLPICYSWQSFANVYSLRTHAHSLQTFKIRRTPPVYAFPKLCQE